MTIFYHKMINFYHKMIRFYQISKIKNPSLISVTSLVPTSKEGDTEPMAIGDSKLLSADNE